MKTKAVRFVMVTVLLLLLVAPAASQVPDDQLVVPGVRIGKWTIEMTIANLTQMNGRPATTIETLVVADIVPPAPQRYYWSLLDFYAITRDGQRVEFLLVDSERFKTEKNVGPGSTRASVLSAYGTPTAETVIRPGRTRMIYDAIGFTAIVDGDQVSGLTAGVNVFRPGTGKSIWTF
jgi:hypothetical protein